MGDIQAWWDSLPPVTRTLFAGSMGVTLAAGFGILPPYWLTFDVTRLYSNFEVRPPSLTSSFCPPPRPVLGFFAFVISCQIALLVLLGLILNSLIDPQFSPVARQRLLVVEAITSRIHSSSRFLILNFNLPLLLP